MVPTTREDARGLQQPNRAFDRRRTQVHVALRRGHVLMSREQRAARSSAPANRPARALGRADRRCRSRRILRSVSASAAAARCMAACRRHPTPPLSSTSCSAPSGWSSQDLVETPSFGLVRSFELLRTKSSEMTVVPRSIVEGIDVVSDVGDRQLTVPVDLFLDPLFLQAAEKRLGDALSQQLPFRLILGSRRFERQNRRHASLPY